MSSIELAGLVLGAFPIILNGLESYRKGFEPLEEWWQFRTHFISFIDDVRHQMMKYNANMIRLLDPIIMSTDDDKLATLLRIPDQSHPDFDLEKMLEGRLASELDRFLRIVNRMHDLILGLEKLLQIEDGKISWLGTDQQKPWQWHLRRIQISFSKGKHRKVKKLAEHNKELEDILGYSERIIPIAERRKTSEPVTRLENMRQHAYAIYRILAKQWKCQSGCQIHAAHLRLSLHAEQAIVSSNVTFRTESFSQSPATGLVQEVVIRPSEFVKPPISIDVSHVSQAEPIAAAQKITIQQDAVSQATPSLKDRILRKIHDRMSAVRLSSRGHRTWSFEPARKKSGFGVVTSKTLSASTSKLEQPGNGSESKSTPLDTPAEVEHATSPIPANAMDLGTIGDLCAFLSVQNRTTGTLDDDDSHQAFTFSKLTNKQQREVTSTTRLHSFCELLDAHHQMKISISRRARFEIATHIASALLQAHLSPWLSPKWTKNDFQFFLDIDTYSVSSIYPSVCRKFAARPDTTLTAEEDTDHNSTSQQDNEEETRTRLFTLGVMILELIFGHTIEACHFRREYLGADGRPNDQTDVSTARRWSRRVLGESGPDVSDVVRRCLDCSFGPQPSFADGRFREAVYVGVILPLANYTKLWPEVMP